MSSEVQPGKFSVGEFADQIRTQMVPVSSRFSYFLTGVSLGEEDLKEYVEEPVGALPLAIARLLPEVSILLVPYLEGTVHGRARSHARFEDRICFEPPDPRRLILSSQLIKPTGAILAFGIRDEDVAEYHYRLYHELAALVAHYAGDETLDQFSGVVREELSANVHGEVDDESWELKQALLRRQRNLKRRTKGFARYARQSFIDSLTLYLHGICCDIDVEAGPRQLASRHVRRRIELLQSLYPAPEGYAVFPEELNHLDELPAG